MPFRPLKFQLWLQTYKSEFLFFFLAGTAGTAGTGAKTALQETFQIREGPEGRIYEFFDTILSRFVPGTSSVVGHLYTSDLLLVPKKYQDQPIPNQLKSTFFQNFNDQDNLHFRWFGTKPNSLVLVGILVTNGSFTIGIFGWYFIERLINFDDFVW